MTVKERIEKMVKEAAEKKGVEITETQQVRVINSTSIESKAKSGF